MRHTHLKNAARPMGGAVAFALALLASAGSAGAQQADRTPAKEAGHAVDRKTAAIPAREPAAGEAAWPLAEGRDQFVAGELDAAVVAFRKAMDAGGPAGDAASRWLAVTLLRRPPSAPIEPIDDLLRTWAEGSHLADDSTWNLALQLVLRQVQAASDSDAKSAAWKAGLDVLRPWADGVRLAASTTADLDIFLALGDGAGGLAPADALADLILLTPDLRTIAALHSRRAGLPVAGGAGGAGGAARRNPAAAATAAQEVRRRASAAWAQMALSAPAGGDEFAAATDAFLKATGVTGMPAAPAGGEPGTPAFDARLIERARAVLAEVSKQGAALAAGENNRGSSARRLALLRLFAGSTDEALRFAYQAVLGAAPADVSARCDELAVVAAIAGGDLRGPAMAERALFRRFGRPDRSGPASQVFDKALGDAAAALEKAPPAKEGATPADTPFVRMSTVAQNGVGQRREAEWADRRSSGARAALARGSDDVAAVAWALALDAPASAAAGALRSVGEDLRTLSDPRRAAAVTGRLIPQLREPRLTRDAGLLHARFLYESSQMQPALAALDAAERVAAAPPEKLTSRERLARGMMRAVALIKLDRTEEAVKLLGTLGDLSGDDHDMAERAFLWGWIHLSRNETGEALTFFRRIVDEHGGSTYAVHARELIRRLQTTDPPPIGAAPGRPFADSPVAKAG